MGKNWNEAQRYCRNKYTDLATIDNMEDMNRLINTVDSGYNGSAWIGLYNGVNSWRWSLEDMDYYGEGETEFRNWDSSDGKYTDQHCVATGEYGTWWDLICNQNHHSVCYNAPAVTKTQQVVRVKLTPKDQNMVLTDPAIQEAILQQIKKELTEKGMSDDVKLRWKEQPDGKIFHKEEKGKK